MQLDEQSYRRVMLAMVSDVRDKVIDLKHKIDGNGKPGLDRRVAVLERFVERFTGVAKIVVYVGGPLVIAAVLGIAGLVWALITGQVILVQAAP